MICIWDNVPSHYMGLTWQFLFPSRKEGQEPRFGKAAGPVHCTDTPTAKFVSNLQMSRVPAAEASESSVRPFSQDRYKWDLDTNIQNPGEHSAHRTRLLWAKRVTSQRQERGWNSCFQEPQRCSVFRGWLLLARCLSARANEEIKKQTAVLAAGNPSRQLREQHQVWAPAADSPAPQAGTERFLWTSKMQHFLSGTHQHPLDLHNVVSAVLTSYYKPEILSNSYMKSYWGSLCNCSEQFFPKFWRLLIFHYKIERQIIILKVRWKYLQSI